MVRVRSAIFVAAVLIGGLFNQGCLGDAGGSVARGALDASKVWLEEKLAAAWPSLEAKAIAAAEAVIEKKEKETLAVWERELLKVAPTDPDTGAKLAKKPLDFDADKSGHIEGVEISKLSAYVLLEGKKRFDEGKISKEEWSETQKNAGKGALGLGALAAAAYAIKKRKKGVEVKPPSGGDPPKAPSPAAAPAA